MKMLKSVALAFATLTLTVVSIGSLAAPAGAAGEPRAPEGFSSFAVFIGDGEYVLGTPHPEIPGCDLVPSFCDGAYFWEEIMGAEPDEIIAREAEAKAFLMERFGLDVDALAASGEILWLDAYVDPRGNYRARVIPGERIHQYGWEVHDQAFLAIANTEITLGGEFEGFVIPPGSMLAQGRYVIERSRLDWVEGHPALTNSGRHIVIPFQSAAPVLASPDPRVAVVGNCELPSSPWGAGLAQVVGLATSEDGITVKGGGRNVLTFDGAAGFGDYPGVYNDPAMTIVD